MSDNHNYITAALSKMETPTYYSIREGTIDYGRDYEIKMAALLLLRCVNHAKTKDTWLAMNMDRCGAFDDVVLYRQTEEGKKTIYLVQLKHELNGSNITSEEFKTKKEKQGNPFSLAKYFESISEISRAGENSESNGKEEEEEMINYLWRHHKDIVFVLFTNRGTTTGCDFLRYVKNASDVDTKWLLYESLNTTSNGSVFEIEYHKLDNKKFDIDPKYLTKFFLFTKQEHISKMDDALTKSIENFIKPVKLSKNQLSTILLKFELYFLKWSKGNLGGHYPMNKSYLLKKLTEFLLDPYMTMLDGHLTNQNLHQKLWNLIIEDKDVIVINEADALITQFVKDAIYSVLKEYCHNLETINWWNSNADVIKKEVATLKASTDTICYMEAYCYLWKTRKMPLVVEVKDSHGAKQLQDILKFSQGIFRVIVLNKTGSFVEKVTGLKVFSNIGALDQDHKNTLLQHPVTLQGRKPSIPLANCVGPNFKHLSVKDIIHILLDKFNVGNELQPYPRFYEEMSLTRVWLKITVLLEVPDDFFLMQYVDSNACRDYLQNYRSDFSKLKICTWQDIKTNSEARIILFEENNHFKIIESYYLKKGKPFHVLVFHKNEHLEWIKSKGSVTNIRPYSKIVTGEFNSIKSKNFTTNMISNRKSVVISSHSGMGKSVLLSFIAQYIPSDWWIVAINLAEHSDDYKIWERQTPSSELFRTLTDKILNNQKCYSQLSKTTFRKYCDNKQVVFFLDGFDEVQVYYHVGVKKLIKYICDTGFIMCITTRPVQQMELETLLNTFSITLNPFTKNNQTNFLKNIFSEAAGVSAFDKRIESFVDSLLVATKANLNDHDNDFAGVPLQTILLADAFTEDCIRYMKNHKFDNNNFDLLYLYKTFVQKKINIAFNKIECISEDMIDNYKVCRSFYALKLLFSEDALESLHIDEKLEGATKLFPTMLQLLQKDGIMAVSSENYVSFIHRSFAEYIAAEWLSENINGKYKEVAKNVLIESFQPNFDVVRNIFDRILAKDCPLHLAIISRQIDKVQEIIGSNADNFRKTDKGNRLFLHLIASWGLHHPLASYSTYTDVETRKLRRLAIEDDMIKIIYLIPNHELMSSCKDDILDYTPLDYALISGSLNIANVLCLKHTYYFPLVEMIEPLGEEYIYKMDYVPLGATHFKYRFEMNNVFFDEFCDKRPEDLSFSAMHQAAKCGDIDTIISSIADEEAINEMDPFTHQTPLHVATRFGQTEIILLLLSSRAKPNIQDFMGRTALLWALCVNDPNELTITSLVVCLGIDINVKDIWGNTALILAAHKGNTNVVKLLLSKGADKEAKLLTGETALHIAAEYGHADVVDVLLAEKPDLEARDNVGRTALLQATSHGYTDVVNLLLSHGSNAEARNNFGYTALLLAIINGRTEVVNLLLSFGANIEVRNNKGDHALFLSAIHGHSNIVNVLLSKGADKNSRNSNGNTALMGAASTPNENSDVVNLLLSQGLDTEALNDDGNTALMLAMLNGHVNTIRILLSKSLEKDLKNKTGGTALAFAANSGQTEIVKVLLQEGLDIDVRTSKGYTPLIVAACGGYVDTVGCLLSLGSDIEARTEEGGTALIAAACHGYPEVLSLLLSKEANIEATNNDGNTALLEAAFIGHADVVSILLSVGADKNSKNLKLYSPLMAAAVGGHSDVVRMLLSTGPDRDAKNINGDTALILAACKGHTNIVVDLISSDEEDYNARNENGHTALAVAADKGHIDVINVLLSHGLDVEAKGALGYTALMTAAGSGHVEIVELLLAHGANTETKTNEGETALMFAVPKGHAEVIKLLLSHGADANAKRSFGNTTLSEPRLKGLLDIAKLLLSHGGNEDATNNLGYTALNVAVTNGHVDVADLLLSHGANPDAKLIGGNTVLMLAIISNRLEMATLLLDRGASLEIRNNGGHHALILAAERGRTEMVRLLMGRCLDIEVKNDFGQTALIAASIGGHTEVLSLLLSQGSDIEAKTHRGQTALILAAHCGHTDVVHLLISRGADKQAKTDDGDTALLLAALQGQTDVVELLLAQGLDKDETVADGYCPLSAAAFKGHTSTVSLLLSHGVQLESKTNKGNTALTAAASNGHLDVVKLLLTYGSNKDAKDNDGNTALLIAASKGHDKVVALLLTHSFDKNVTNNSGDNALTCAERNGHNHIVLLLSQE